MSNFVCTLGLLRRASKLVWKVLDLIGNVHFLITWKVSNLKGKLFSLNWKRDTAASSDPINGNEIRNFLQKTGGGGGRSIHSLGYWSSSSHARDSAFRCFRHLAVRFLSRLSDSVSSFLLDAVPSASGMPHYPQKLPRSLHCSLASHKYPVLLLASRIQEIWHRWNADVEPRDWVLGSGFRCFHDLLALPALLTCYDNPESLRSARVRAVLFRNWLF